MLKNRFWGVALAAAAISLPSLNVAHADSSEMRDVGEFTEIETHGSPDISITLGQSYSVEVMTSEEENLPFIITEVRGGTLSVFIDDDHDDRPRRWRGRVKVAITAPSIESYQHRGSGDTRIVNLNADEFEFESGGSGDTTISGTCGTLRLDMAGSGDFDGRGLSCGNSEIDKTGSGDVELSTNGEVSITSRGSGDIELFGSPSVKRLRMRGSGELEIRN